jgi:hypothetical protein
MPWKRRIESMLSVTRRRMCRAIAGSFHSGTRSLRMISRLSRRRRAWRSSSVVVRKPNHPATSLSEPKNQSALSASVPSKSKTARSYRDMGLMGTSPRTYAATSRAPWRCTTLADDQA